MCKEKINPYSDLIDLFITVIKPNVHTENAESIFILHKNHFFWSHGLPIVYYYVVTPKENHTCIHFWV